jgi:8-oxo-dGTP diphosphatase
MRHRISAGALVVHRNRLLLARHFRPGKYDFWAPPGGGVEGDEELSATAEREAREETGLHVRATALAYIDELIDASGRLVKFWYLAEYISGEIDVHANPATEEAIIEAAWFGRADLPHGHVFPAPLRGRFWDDLGSGFPAPVKLPLMHSIF